MQKDTKKRAPGVAIIINKNVEQVKSKIDDVCAEHGVTVSALFESVVRNLSPEQWKEYAEDALRVKEQLSVQRKVARLERQLGTLKEAHA